MNTFSKSDFRCANDDSGAHAGDAGFEDAGFEDAEARFRGVLNFSSVWYWELDDQYRFVPPRLDSRENHGKLPAGHLGKVIWDINMHGVPAAEFDIWKATLQAREAFRDFVFLRASADGKYRWVRAHGEPVFDGQGRFRGYQGISQDMTEQRQAEQRMALQLNVTRILSEADALDDAMPRILRAVCETMGWDYAAWWPHCADTGSFHCARQWSRPRLQDSNFKAFAEHADFLACPTGLLGRAFASRRPQWIFDIACDSSLTRREDALAAGLTGAFALPVIEGDQVLGVIEFFARRVFEPDFAINDAAAAAGLQIGQFIVRRQAERRYRELVELSPEGILVQTEGRIVFLNSALANLLRAPSVADVIGRRVLDFIHPDHHGFVEKGIERTIRDKQVLRCHEIRGVRRDGTEGIAELSMSPIEFDGRPAVQAVVRDVTDRRELEHKVLRLSNLYAVLGRIGEAVVRQLDPQKMFEEVCRIAVETGQFSQAGVLLIDEQSRTVAPVAAAGANEFFRAIRLHLDGGGAESRGPGLTAIREDRPYVCQDTAMDPRAAPWRAQLLAAGMRSSVNAPLRRAGTVIGLFVLYAGEADYFDEELVELVVKIASTVSFAIDAMDKERQRSDALQALDEKERTISALLSNLAGMAYRCRNDARWSMEFVSDGCRELTGYQPEDLVGNRAMSYADLIHPEDRKRVWAEVQQAGMERFVLRYRILTAAGELRWVWEQGQGVYDADGRLIALEGIIQDVTAQVTAEKNLIERKEQLRMALEASDQGLWDWDLESGRIYYDESAARILGQPARAIEAGLDLFKQALHPEDIGRLLDSVRENISGKLNLFQADCRLLRSTGDIVWAGIRGRVMERTPEGRALRMAGTIQDISERKRAEARLTFLAQYDVLTGLPNRSLMKDRLSLAIARADRNRELAGLMFVNLDRFNQINDTLGHAIGDRVLQEVSARLRECLESVDTIARSGGDEFALIVEEAGDPMQVVAVADDVRRAFSLPLSVDGHEIFLGASIGIAVYPDDSGNAEELLKNADMALHRAKRQGGDGHVLYRADMASRSIQRLTMENELRRALERDEFTLHYQPKVDVRTRRILGAEALIRWNSRAGLVSPAEFIPIAEENGLILDIGAWVLETACSQAAKWQQADREPLRIAVNLSPRQFMQKNLLEMVSGVLERTGLAPQCLELEITESMLMQQGESVVDVLHNLSAAGIRLAIDDFGTGYSSLAYLKRFPVQDIKIDRSFVNNLTVDPDDAAIVTAIVSMAHSLGLKLIAEGVETEAQLRFLRSVGCDTFQGYLFSKPVTAAAYEQMLEQQRDRANDTQPRSCGLA